MPTLKYMYFRLRYKIHLGTKIRILNTCILDTSQHWESGWRCNRYRSYGDKRQIPVNPSFLPHHRVLATPSIMFDAVAI